MYVKELKIKLPKWKWWQIGIIVALIILAFRIDPNKGLEVLKKILEK